MSYLRHKERYARAAPARIQRRKEQALADAWARSIRSKAFALVQRERSERAVHAYMESAVNGLDPFPFVAEMLAMLDNASCNAWHAHVNKSERKLTVCMRWDAATVRFRSSVALAALPSKLLGWGNATFETRRHPMLEWAFQMGDLDGTPLVNNILRKAHRCVRLAEEAIAEARS